MVDTTAQYLNFKEELGTNFLPLFLIDKMGKVQVASGYTFNITEGSKLLYLTIG